MWYSLHPFKTKSTYTAAMCKNIKPLLELMFPKPTKTIQLVCDCKLTLAVSISPYKLLTKKQPFCLSFFIITYFAYVCVLYSSVKRPTCPLIWTTVVAWINQLGGTELLYSHNSFQLIEWTHGYCTQNVHIHHLHNSV